MANFTTTTGAKFIPARWLTEVKAAHKANQHLAKLIKVIPHGMKRGNTIYLPIPGRISAVAKVADTAVTYKTDTATQFTLTIDRHYAVPLLIEDIVDSLSQPGMREYYMDDIGYGLAQEVDQYLHTLGATFGGGDSTAGAAYSKAYVGDGTSALSLWDGSANGNAGNGVAYADYILRSAMQKLEDADVRKQLNFVIPPVVKKGMLGVDRYVSSDFVSKKAVVDGEFGNVYGVRMASSTNAATVLADNSSDSYRAGLLFTEDAIVYAEPKKVELVIEESADYLGTKMVGHQIYGAKTFRAEDGIALIFPA